MTELFDKRVLITGASSGIGAAAAVAFAEAGADVALLARGEAGLEQVAARVRARGRRAVTVPVDVADRGALEAAVARVEAALGGIDVLLPNAALTVYGPFRDVAAEDFERAVQATFFGAVNVVRAALPALERSHGAIVATGSLMSDLPLPMFSSYASAKHALRGFLGTLRVELRAQRSPVTVSMLHPGAVDTPVWQQTASATGRLPRRPPEAYATATVARALVALASNPRPEVTIGGEANVLGAIIGSSPAIGDLVLTWIYRYYRSGRRRADGAPGLWQPTGRGATADGIPGRGSLTLPVRMALWRVRAAAKRFPRRSTPAR